MAIVQISRIQHRKGLMQDLPQLASAEIAWALDEQRLFIGNGSLAEGAPFLGNTEILTEHSDLLNSAAPYTFQGNSTSQTLSTNAGAGVTRSLQDRLDDYVSARAFGIEGNDVYDSTDTNEDKFTFALTELYGRGYDPQTRIGFYIPAGVYEIKAPIELPPYAFIFGDGPGRTIIYNKTNSEVLFKTVEIADAVIDGADVLSQEIVLQGITFEHRAGGDLTEVSKTAGFTAFNCEFKGSYTDLTSISSTQTAFSFQSTPAVKSEKIRFHLCTFTQLGFALEQAESVSKGISFNQCNFNNVKIAIQTSDDADTVMVQNCVFDAVSQQALKALNATKIISIGNQYLNCGNRGTSTPNSPVISFSGNGSVSWADHFDRPASAVVARIELSGVTKYAYMDAADKFSWGHKDHLTTFIQTLQDNDSGSLTGVQFNPDDNHQAELMYTITRSGEVQSGTLRIAIISGKASISDDFTYTGTGDAGVTFSLTETGGVVTIDWVTSGTGDNAVITVSPVTIREI